MIWDIESVLVLSPHTDDMELGAGATVRRMVEAGASVKSVVFSDCKESVDTTRFPEDVLRKECLAAAKHLGIKDVTILDFPVRKFPQHRQEILEEIYALRKETNYDLVISSWTGDLHQDHRTVAHETLRAFLKQDASLLAYEIPGNCPDFAPQIYFAVSEEEVEKKIELLQQYESQVVRRGYFHVNAIKSSMAYRGIHIGESFAEAFVQERAVIKGFRRD